MNAVEKIKVAAAKLDPDEQVAVFRWWVESDAFKQRQLAALKRDLAVGIEQLGAWSLSDLRRFQRDAVGGGGEPVRQRAVEENRQEPEGMNPYRVSDEARADLDEIWFNIAQDELDAAARFIRALVSRFPTLACMPHLGRPRHDLSPRLRSFPVGNHVIFTAHGKRCRNRARVARRKRFPAVV